MEINSADFILIILCLICFNRCSVLFFFRLEKEYTTIKTKEMEEQVEIKVCGHTLKSQSIPCKQFVVFFFSHVFLQFCLFQRLRTENRLLKQRIDTLEKVSESVFVTVRHCALLINFTLTHSAVYVHISCVFPNDGVLSFTNWAVLVESCWYAIMDWHGECSDCR